MKIKLRKSDNSRYIFYLAYALIFIRAFLYTTAFDSIFPSVLAQGMRLFAYMLLFFRVFLIRKVNYKFFLIGIVLLGISLISGLESSYASVWDYALCCVCSIEIDFKDIVKEYEILSVGLTIMTILASLTGIIENYVYYRQGMIRMSLGFVYPTDFAAHIFFMSAGFCYLYFEKLKLWHGIFWVSAAYGIYLLTNARGPAAMILIVFVICYWGKSMLSFSRMPFPKILLKYSSVICAVLTFLLIFLYDMGGSIWKRIDKFSSQRLSLASKLMKQNSITMFGQYIHQKGDGHGVVASRSANEYTYIDLSFMRILLLYGVALFVIILILSVLINKNAIKKNNYSIPILMLVVSFYSLTAQHYFDFSYNFLLLAYFTNIEKTVVSRETDQKYGRKRRKLVLYKRRYGKGNVLNQL